MARGITETDVWQAADALLLEGQRPTIERVRTRIGRGSPNTVSPHLETWFKHLGGRIQDPQAFSASPALPDPIQQAAQHFWEVALSLGRQACDTDVEQARAEADARVEAAAAAQRQAEQQAEQARQRSLDLAAELDARSRALETERLTLAAQRSRMDALQQQLERQAGQLAQLQTELTLVRDEARRDVAQADERAQAAERRAALEIDRERQARGRAEKRAEQLELKLEEQRHAAQTEALQQVEQQARRSAELQALQEQGRLQAAALDQAQREARAALQQHLQEQGLRLQIETRLAALLREQTLQQRNSSPRPLRKSLHSPARKRPAAGSDPDQG